MNIPKLHKNIEQITASLTNAGIAPENVEAIIDGIEHSSNIEFVERACYSGRPVKIVLAVAIVLAGKFKMQDQNLAILLNYLYENIADLDIAGRGMYWHIKGYTSWRLNNSPYPALRFLNLSRECLTGAQTQEASFYLARVYDTLGQMSYSNGHYYEAEGDYEEALKIREQFDDNYGKALTYGNLGRLHMEIGNFALAYDYFHKDLEIIRTFYPEMTRIQIQLLSHLGSCLIEQKKLAKAKDLLQQSRLLAEEFSDYIGQFFAAIGAGKIFIQKKKIADAIEQRDKAQQIVQAHFEGILKLELLGIVHHLTGLIQSAEKKYPEALVTFETAYQQINNSPGFSPVQRAQLLIDYAAAASQLQEMAIAASLLQEALTYLDTTSAEELRNLVEKELKTNFKQTWLQHSIRRFTGLKKADFLLEEAGQAGFRGIHRNVAILVSDIRNFTGISEMFDPRDLILFINEYFSRMIRCVDHFNGYVDKIIGDAVMSIFTIPKPQENDAERAVHTALLMLEALKKFNECRPAGVPALEIGIGIHFGKVVAGLIGSPSKRSYTILGDTVNTAFRLESMTKDLGVSLLVTDALLAKLPDKNKYLFRPLGRFCPRGRKDFISIYEMIGEKLHRDAPLPILEEIRQSENALHQFYQRRFEAAATAFEDCYETTGINAFKVLQKKAKYFHQHPPPEDWQGEVTLNNK